ncbi:MAG: DNA primase [Actinobacteria bacterium]|nr:DNA primase [Actinomycetota bacterium]
MAIADTDIERLRESVSIVDTIQGYVQLRRVGRNWVGLCPFHAEKSGSFNVREETRRYKCFGCGASGDVFKFIQEIEHLDFVGAIEHIAGKAGYQLTYTTGGQSKDRQRSKQLTEIMAQAVEWYHNRLLTAPDARVARDYLRDRGLSGDVAREFKLGWAPDDWDALSRDIGVSIDLLRETGLGFVNKRGKPQDSFRARVMFPIFRDSGEPVAFGGRVLPGSADPAKYKNSPETAIYAKSKTLYGLNWAKAEIVTADEVIVCEGYTDVIGFQRSGIKRAVATCGTALTEDHVRLLKRFATKVVLAFDADKAGQGAAERFYEWEQRYKVQVSVAHFPQGKDPGDLANSDPTALASAVANAQPFLGFRLQRVLDAGSVTSPESRSRTAEQAMAVINEHPDTNVRKIYAGQVATHVGIPVVDLVKLAERGIRKPTINISASPNSRRSESAEFVVLALMFSQWEIIANWLSEALFTDEVNRRAFLSVAQAEGNVSKALELADPEAREVLERAAVADVETQPIREAWNLLSAAVRRELAHRVTLSDPEQIRIDRSARLLLENLEVPTMAESSAEQLLGWLNLRVGEHE